MAPTAAQHQHRCLIVERHAWETGGRQQQLQFVLETAHQFFGPGTVDRRIRVRVFIPPTAPAPIVERDASFPTSIPTELVAQIAFLK